MIDDDLPDRRFDADEAAEEAEARARAARQQVERARATDWQRYFPPGVSVRLANDDIAGAQALLPAARQVMARALALHDTGQSIVRLTLPGTDGSLIHAFIHGPVKHLYVQPGPKVNPVVTLPEEEIPLVASRCPDVLSGVVRPGEATLVSEVGEDPPRYSVHEFHPTQVAADTYDLLFDWQDMERLAVEADPAVAPAALSSLSTLQVRYPKPSNYSGAMKRVVQAMYGMGQTSYVDKRGELPRFIDWDTQNHFHYQWGKTDGIFKFQDEYWVVRIGLDIGVIAQRLAVFQCTTGGGYADALLAIGDTETAAIVTEFGGLPTGEDFPIEIEDAITAGSVLRLMSADAMLPFYKDGSTGIDKHGFFPACGWAFSDSGLMTSIHNTCWWYSRQDIVDMPFQGWATDGFANADPLDRYMRAEHWKIELAFFVNENGETVGGATLSMVEEQPLEAPNSMNLIDQGTSEGDSQFAPQVGHYPTTGHLAWYLDPPQLYPFPAGILAASGMNPLRFPDNFTPRLHDNPLSRSGAQAAYLSHSALMAVPRDDGTDRLDRFTFWGRSQSGIFIADMEDAAEAPVLVFYHGDELEIVRRKADRYVSDREAEVPFDVNVPGTYYPGDFFATSLNMLDPVSGIVNTVPGATFSPSLAGQYAGPTPRFAVVGLIIPAGVREGYVFVKAEYDLDKVADVGGEVITYKGFFAGLGVVELAQYVSDSHVRYTVPNFGTFTIGLYELMVIPSWWAMWTNIFFDWNLGINGVGMRFAASISALSQNHAMHDEPQLGWRLLDVPFSYRLSLPFPTSVTPDGLPAVYRYVLPEGIVIADVNPTAVTFVGGV